jgi:hypothetical protein
LQVHEYELLPTFVGVEPESKWLVEPDVALHQLSYHGPTLSQHSHRIQAFSEQKKNSKN